MHVCYSAVPAEEVCALWLQQLPEVILSNEDLKEQFSSLLRAYLLSNLELLQRLLAEHGASAQVFDVNLQIKLYFKLLASLIKSDLNVTDLPEEQVQNLMNKLYTTLEPIVFYSLLLTYGQWLTAAGQRKLSDQVKHVLKVRNAKLLAVAQLQAQDNLYDYRYDVATQRLVRWSDELAAATLALPKQAYEDIYVPTAQFLQLSYYMNYLVDHHRNIMVAGDAHCGKTAFLNRFLQAKSQAQTFIYLGLSYSSQSAAPSVLEHVLSNLEIRRRSVIGPQLGKSFTVFIDDYHLPLKSARVAPVEIIREIAEKSACFQMKDLSSLKLEDVSILCSIDAASTKLSRRVFTHFCYFRLQEMSAPQVLQLFTAKLLTHNLKSFQSPVAELIAPLVELSLQCFQLLRSALRPTPKQVHLSFTLCNL